MVKQSLKTQFGNIDYHYSDGLLIFLGSFIEKEYRGQGKWKEMVDTLFKMFPKGTKVQVPVTKKFLVDFFESKGFKKVEKIEYWGNPINTINFEGII